MRLRISDRSNLKVPFLCGGAVVGILGSAWYLWRNQGVPVPDPVWTRVVNVSLLIFAAVYGANLLRRAIELAGKYRPPGGSS